jgi:hypothetical protein
MDFTIYRRHTPDCDQKPDRYAPRCGLVPIQLETGFYHAGRQQAKTGSEQVGSQHWVVVGSSDQC